MKIELETKRLYLRKLTPEDAIHFFSLNADPEVLRFTGDSPFKNLDQARQFLEAYDPYSSSGYGRWAVLRKDDEKFLGWCGLKLHEDNKTDIGFRFYRDEWNKGYATESAKTCIDYGFSKFMLSRIIGRAMKENMASIQVLKKIGLTYKGDIFLSGKPAVLMYIDNHKSAL